MKRKLLVVLGTLILLSSAVTIAGASAEGQNASQLEDAGWTCIVAGPSDWIHCFPPSQNPSAAPATLQVKVFDVAGYPFLGTELLIRADLYHGQPCPQDDSETYEPVPGMPYLACHHFQTGHH